MKLTDMSRISKNGQSKKYAHDVVEFEKKLAAVSPDEEDRNDVTVSTIYF